jgi:hypothetical protein
MRNPGYVNSGSYFEEILREHGLLDDNRHKKDDWYEICWRILENGILNLFLLDGDGGKNIQYLFRLAKSWVFSPDQSGDFSFDRLWQLVYPHIDVEIAKNHLRKRCEEIEKEINKKHGKTKSVSRRKRTKNVPGRSH